MSTSAYQPAPASSIFCASCSTANRVGTAFCRGCGGPLCPNCGAVFEPPAKFCDSCGAARTAQTAPASPATDWDPFEPRTAQLSDQPPSSELKPRTQRGFEPPISRLPNAPALPQPSQSSSRRFGLQSESKRISGPASKWAPVRWILAVIVGVPGLYFCYVGLSVRHSPETLLTGLALIVIALLLSPWRLKKRSTSR